jgi:hypothetical protein
MGADEYGRSKSTLPASRSPLLRLMRSARVQPAELMAETRSLCDPTSATLIGSAGIPSAV